MSGDDPGAGDASLTTLPPRRIAALQRVYDVWNRGGPEAMAREMWDAEIVWHDPPDFPDATVVRGAAAVEQHLANRLQFTGRAPVTVRRASATPDGQVLLIELSLHAGGEASGVRLETPLFHVVRMRDRRMIEVREFLSDRDDAVAAIGDARA